MQGLVAFADAPTSSFPVNDGDPPVMRVSRRGLKMSAPHSVCASHVMSITGVPEASFHFF